MKKISIAILAIIAIIAIIVACQKTPEVNLEYVDVERDLITVGTTTATIQCDYEYIATLKKAYLYYGEGEDAAEMASIEMRVVQKTLYVELSGLKENTTYSYYYEFANGFNSMRSATKTFKTEAGGSGGGDEPPTPSEITLPTVVTSEVTEIATNSALCGGEVTNDGGAEVTERGICWSTNANPSLNDNHIASGTGTGAFTTMMDSLAANTTYHVRAYAINEKGTAYGLDKEFVTASIVVLPTVTTAEITEITTNSAVCGGEVTNDGGAEVTERGICWSTNANPTLDNNHVAAGAGTGVFTAAMNGLEANTTYHVRAYAINEKGTAYGLDKEFKTLAGGGSANLPTVTTKEVTGVTSNSAQCGGDVTSDGGAPVTERGICWSTNGNPTLSDSHIAVGSGTGSFTYILTGLTASTTYHVRAFATNEAGTAYGLDKTFTTLSGGGGGGGDVPTGATNGLFTINAYGDKVYFSQGNLQYQASTGIWRFAENQYDYVGNENLNISPTYDGWIDIFCWGTSGWDNGNLYYQPYNAAETTYNPNNGYGYGPTDGTCYTFDLAGEYANADWGVYNAISNGGNMANQWRTLSLNEWSCVLEDRTTLSGIRYAKAVVNNVNGVVLLPDNWDPSVYALNHTNASQAPCDSNVITAIDWSMIETYGAVFLPASGYRYVGVSVEAVGRRGKYWSISGLEHSSHAWAGVDISAGSVIGCQCWKNYGCSVRLVHDVQ